MSETNETRMKPAKVLSKELNLFQLPPLNSSFVKRQWVEHQPTFQGGKSSVEFSISGSGNQYTDLSRSYLYTKVKITKPNKGAIFVQDERTSTALPIDNVLHSLWSDVHVKFNSTLVSTSNTNYSYKAYIENMLKFNSMAKERQMSLVGFTGDKGFFDQIDPDQDPYSLGLRRRFYWFKKIHTKYSSNSTEDQNDTSEIWSDPNSVEFMGPLLADICQQDRLVINGVNIDLKLLPNKDSFRLISFPDGTEAEIHLEETKLMVCRVTVSNEAFLGIEDNLKKMPVVYPHARTDLRTFNIASGSYSATYEDLFQGEVPSKVVVGMVDSKAFTGDFSLNPFRFRPFDIESLAFYVDDESTPRQPINFDVRDSGYIEGLQSLYEVTGKWTKNTDIDISRESFRQGLFLIGFDIDGATSPNLTSFVGENKTGRTRLMVKFHKALPKNVTLIVYAAFQEVAQIDAARNVSLMEKDKKHKD